MSDIKTTRNTASVDDFINSVSDDQKQSDARKLVKLLEEVTGEKAVMWGASIVGFGSYHYKYASGREADWMAIGFSPRQQNLTIYLMDGFEKYAELLEKLGPHSTGKSCLYLKKLDDADHSVLKELAAQSYEFVTTEMDQQ